MAQKLSDFENSIYLLLQANTPITTISNTLKKPYKSIINAASRIKKKKALLGLEKRGKKGAISKLQLREKRALKRDITRSPKKTNNRLLLENNLSISKRTLQRFLKEEGYTINIATKKPYINALNAKLRLKYAKEALKNKNITLNKIIFSNESSIQRGHGARPEYYRKRGKIRVGKYLVSIANKSKFFKLSNKLFYSIFYLVFF